MSAITNCVPHAPDRTRPTSGLVSTVYANTFWLPSIVRRIDGTNDITVGLLPSLPWICAVFAMHYTSKIGDRTGNRRPLLIMALLTAAVGTLLAAIATPWIALIFLCIAAMGFKSASPLFWSIPQSTLHPMVLAAAIAVINSVGNLGGFVAPFGFGLIQEATGEVTWGLYALAAASAVAAASVLLIKKQGHAAVDVPDDRDPSSTSATAAAASIEKTGR